MTLSFNKLNEIAALYESIAASEQEQLNEAPMTPFQAAGGNAKLAQLNKGKSPRQGRATASTIEKQGQDNLYKAGGGDAAIAKGATTNRNVRGGGTRQVSTLNRQDIINRGSNAAAKTAIATKTDPKTDPKPDPKTPIIAKPQPKVAPTKPAGSAMDQWAKANPKLAAAKAERDRTRGTSATTNPLMKDTKSSLPAPAAKVAPASSTLKSATDAASKPSAFKPATTAVASSTTDKGAVPATNAIAAAPKPKPVTPTRMPLAASYEYDAYDLVLEYLLSQGHAETVAEAQYLMTEMDAEMIGDIVEARMDPRGRPASGPMNVYAKSKGKPDQAHLDAVKAYDEKQKKKTPEQRKKELDDYKERQRNR